jgi:hypothetical protein
MKMIGLMLASLLAGCSIVQWMPSSACDQVQYTRVGDEVEVHAEGCKV